MIVNRQTLSLISSHKLTQGYEFLSPSISGFLSKSVSMLVTFPLEYQATLKQGNLLRGAKSLSNGFGYTLYRELVYSTCFWTIQDYLYKRTKLMMDSDRKAYIISSFASSLVSGTASYPFDLFKTWKISYPEKFINSNSVKVTNAIFKEKGGFAIMAGNRIIK